MIGSLASDDRATEAAIIGLIVVILALLLIMSGKRFPGPGFKNGGQST